MGIRLAFALAFFPLQTVFALLSPPEPDRAPAVTVHAAPDPVYAERTADGTTVSCEFALTNATAEPQDLVLVWAKSFAADGSLLARNKVDSNGTRPSMEVLGRRKIEPHATLTVFNPFPAIRTAVPIARMEYEFVLLDASGARQRVRAEIRPLPFVQKTKLVLPVAGRRLWAYDGPGFLSHHRRIDLQDPMNRDVLKLRGNSQRYALDLVVVDDKGEFAGADLEKKESWFGFGVPVIAPAAGTVVEAEGSLPDDIPYDESKMKENPRASVGYHVILDHGNGEFSLLAHFRQGSVRVAAGRRVAQGEVLGQMSRSGMGSQLVHVHYELRTSGDLMSAEGLPARFERFRRAGAPRDESGPIDAGWIVTTPSR